MNARVPRGPPGPSVEKRGEIKCRFSFEKKSACLRGSQVIEEPCVGGEDSSSIRLALVPFRSILLSTVLFPSIFSPSVLFTR